MLMLNLQRFRGSKLNIIVFLCLKKRAKIGKVLNEVLLLVMGVFYFKFSCNMKCNYLVKLVLKIMREYLSLMHYIDLVNLLGFS